jgi:hypothetical protein
MHGVACDASKLAANLWTSHGHKIVKEVDPKYLDARKCGGQTGLEGSIE